MARLEIPVEGMQCTGCERTLSNALERLDGVRRAEADHTAARVKVSFDSDVLGEEKLRHEIEQTGYEPR